jgi:HEAT repeat protein
MKSTRAQEHQGTRVLMTYALMTCALFVFGCKESLRTTYTPAGASPIDELVPEAARIIQEGLTDKDPLIRANTIEVIADTKRTKLMPKVERLLKDEFSPVRFLAALAIGDLEYHLAKNEVAELLKDRDENVRIAAAYAMNKLGSKENFEILREKIASEDQKVRANAALLLGKSGDKSVLKFLYWALRHKDSDDKVRFQAAEAIARLGDERIYPKLWAMLISVYADDRVVGVRAMGALGTEEAKNALITKLDDDVLEVRLAAAEQLGMLGETTGEAEVLKVFIKNLTAGLDKEELERVNRLTALAIGQIGTASLTKFLPQLLKNESKSVRIAAAKAVFQCTMKTQTAENSRFNFRR